MPPSDLIDREFLARRAPKPVTFSWYLWPNKPTGEMWRFNKEAANRIDRELSCTPGDPVFIRMSDGSLVIVRRKR